MRRRTPNAIESRHPAYEYHCRVGELSDAGGHHVGHVVVVVWTHGSRPGRLLSRRNRPSVTADLQLFPAGLTRDSVLEDDTLDLGLDQKELTVAVGQWARGQLEFDGTTYGVRWLSHEQGDEVAMERWGWDLPGQRQRS